MSASTKTIGIGWENTILVLDQAYKASFNLKVIDPHTKKENSEEITAAVKALEEASVVYILGYGFDKNNNERLGVDESLYLIGRESPKCVMFTNFGNSERINKSASRLFFHNTNQFSFGQTEPKESQQFYCEMSVRNVYEALELDFESLEDYFGRGSPNINTAI
jgi:hypothetical protein